MHHKISADVDGGRAEGLACAEPEARTPSAPAELSVVLIAKNDPTIYVLWEGGMERGGTWVGGCVEVFKTKAIPLVLVEVLDFDKIVMVTMFASQRV